MSYTLAEIAKIIHADIQGDPHCEITGIASIITAQAGEISFLANTQYLKFLPATKASAVILKKEFVQSCNTYALVVKDPELSWVKLIPLFRSLPSKAQGIHSTAVIGQNCIIGPNVAIGAYCVIEDEVKVGANTVIQAGTIIGVGSSIGNDCHLYGRVTLYHDVHLGDRVILHSGVVIGSDGFGLVRTDDSWVKIPQVGRVLIGHDVEIGANTTVDRGALDDTVIENGVKIDNLVQVAHNVKIGAHTAIAGCTGIAGSTEIGRHCMLGGGSCINGHIKITDGVIIGGMGAVGRSVTEPGYYSSGIGILKHKDWRRNMFRFAELDAMAKRIRKLEKIRDESYDEH